jgi:hypothetical protein
MDMVAPAGPMYQAGTLSGNPLAMTAGATPAFLIVFSDVFLVVCFPWRSLYMVYLRSGVGVL